MDPIMKQRLEAVLASYGADPKRWPAAERAQLLPHLEAAGDPLVEARLIDRLLDLAMAPPLAADLEDRLMARVRTTRAARFPLGWPAALPLAASLALGIYLGAMGSLDGLLPSVVTDNVAALGDDEDMSGAVEATDYSEDQLS